MKCKYCGYEDHSFARVCPICGEAVEEQTVGVRNAGIKISEAKKADMKTAGTKAAEPPQLSREATEIKESREAKDKEAGEEKSVCPKCGHIDTADTVFCPKCGTRIKELSYCKYCGAQQDGISQYCSNCGRDKEGKLKPKFANVQEFAEKLPEIKLNQENAKSETSSKAIATGGAGIVLLILMFTNWLHVGAVSVLNSLGDFFGYSVGLKTDYSIFGIAQILWKYGGEFGDESTKIKAAGAALMIAGGIAVLCALAAIVYTIEKRLEVQDALKHASGLIVLLTSMLWIGSIYINHQLSSEMHYPGNAIECTGWLYLSAIVALFLLVKGISLITSETTEYTEVEDKSDNENPEEGNRAFEAPQPAKADDYISEETQFSGQHFFRSNEERKNNKDESEPLQKEVMEQQKPEEIRPEKAPKKKKKIILACLLVLILAFAAYFAVSKFLSTPEETEGNYYVCGLAPAFDGNLYGYINEAGDFKIEPIYEDAKPFNANGVACVSIDGKWGHINKKGEFIVKPQFDAAYYFDKNDVARVSKDNKYGMIDADGEVIVQPKYGWYADILELGEFAENGLAHFYEKKKGGYINTKGEIVIPAQYEMADDFSTNGLARIRRGENFGFINAQGEEVIPCRYEYAGDFFKDYPALVCKDGKYGYIDDAGAEVIKIKYADATDFIGGYASVQGKNGKWGAIDTSGEYLIKPKYDEAFNFSADHFAVVNKDGEAYLIDTQGTVLCRLGYANDYSMGDHFIYNIRQLEYISTANRADLETYELFPYKMPVPIGIPNGYNWEWNYGYDYTYGYLDMQGNIVIDPLYQMAYRFAENGLARVMTADPGEGFINTSGEFVTETNYSHIENDFENASVVAACTDDYIDILDKNGIVIEQIALEDANEDNRYTQTRCGFVSSYNDGYTTILIERKDTWGNSSEVIREIVYKGTEKVFDSDFTVEA